MRVLVFGDSIAYGAWDSQGGWVERLKSEAHKEVVNSQGERKIQVLNLGIGGDTSTKILARLKSETDARFSPNWPFVFVFLFNANDERAVDGVVETEAEQFAENVRQIIATTKNYSNNILFVGNTPLASDVLIFKGSEYSEMRIKQYDEIVRNIAEEAGVNYVATRPVFEEKGVGSLMSWDDLHPNDAGHAVIAGVVKTKLWEMIS